MSQDQQEFKDYSALDLYHYFKEEQGIVWDLRIAENGVNGKEKYPIAKGNRFVSDLPIRNKHFSGSVYVTPYDLQYTYDGQSHNDGSRWRKFLSKHHKDYVKQSLAYLEQERAKWLEHRNNMAQDGLAVDFANNKIQELEGHRDEILLLKKEIEKEQEQNVEQSKERQ